MKVKHYWDNDKHIDDRIHNQFETPGWIYVISNKFINDEYGCELSKIGFSAKPLQAVRRWRRDAEADCGWIIYGVYGRVDSCSDHRLHHHLMHYGIERVDNPRLGREWFKIKGEDAAAIVKFYLSARKKYPLRVWVPKELAGENQQRE